MFLNEFLIAFLINCFLRFIHIYSVHVQKKRDQIIFNILYKIRVILIKFGTPFFE